MLRALDGRLVTSVCSVMSPLRAIGGEQFVAGHPLAGSQHRGVAAARADLFEGATWFVDRDEPLVNALIADCGARPELVDAATHDRALAMTSHLPQVLSTALAAYLSGENVDPRFAGPGLRTFLRLAASEASVWMPTLEANRGNVQPHIDGVAAIARAVADGDAEPFARAHEFFNRLS
jgi:prephenate dehydrogenase